MDEIMRVVSEHGDRLALAIVLGGLIGLERELRGKPAGLRTNILIAVGSSLLMVVSSGVAAMGHLGGDPGRIAAQVVTGIGFIGAGTILQSRGAVTGLTSAATIWVVAGIGLAVGSGMTVLAVGATVLILVCLILLGKMESWLVGKRQYQTYEIVVDREAPPLVGRVSEEFEKLGIFLENIGFRREKDRALLVVSCSCTPHASRRAFDTLARMEDVREVALARL